MNIDYPAQSQMEQLRRLWQETFGDGDAFLDHFYTYGFAPDRCRCVTVDGQVAAALYWFDCSLEGRPLAYLYAVATGKAFRRKGICRELMENTHDHLRYLGYAGAVLVPAEKTLFEMYGRMGYSLCSYVSEFTCQAAPEAAALEELDVEQYRLARREFLPQGGVLQEGDNLEFLKTMVHFYRGTDFLVCVSKDGGFFAPELLGNPQSAPGILAALHKPQGHFRCPGHSSPFAMYCPLRDGAAPSYFGLAFD